MRLTRQMLAAAGAGGAAATAAWQMSGWPDPDTVRRTSLMVFVVLTATRTRGHRRIAWSVMAFALTSWLLDYIRGAWSTSPSRVLSHVAAGHSPALCLTADGDAVEATVLRGAEAGRTFEDDFALVQLTF